MVFRKVSNYFQKKIQQISRSHSLVVHMDGKLGNVAVDRIAISVSHNCMIKHGTSKFIGAPASVDSSTGSNVADAVYNKLVEWNIADRVSAFCFDTTNTYTVIKKVFVYR